jgi:hypothetical protein
VKEENHKSANQSIFNLKEEEEATHLINLINQSIFERGKATHQINPAKAIG